MPKPQPSAARRAQTFRSKNGDPSAEANYGLDLFLSKYFLDASGKPDRAKTPFPLHLPGLRERVRVHQAAEQVPGLSTCTGGYEAYERVLVIGWDRAAVNREAEEIDAKHKQRSRVEEGVVTREWADWMAIHARLKARVGGQRGFEMANALGSYVVRCEMIESQCYVEEDGEGLRMRICRVEHGGRGLFAEFDFVVLEGAMLMTKDKGTLARIRAVKERGEDEDEEATDDEDEEEEEQIQGFEEVEEIKEIEENGEEEEDEDDEKNDDVDNSDSSVIFLHSRKRRASASATHQPPKKKSKSSTEPPKLQLYWRGRETGESVIELDHGNSHIGSITFRDNSCMKFAGAFDYPNFGKDVAFQGYKVAEGAQPSKRHWSEYSEKAYERARVGRWH